MGWGPAESGLQPVVMPFILIPHRSHCLSQTTQDSTLQLSSSQTRDWTIKEEEEEEEEERLLWQINNNTMLYMISFAKETPIKTCNMSLAWEPPCIMI